MESRRTTFEIGERRMKNGKIPLSKKLLKPFEIQSLSLREGRRRVFTKL
jgi:hypothetical protein